MSNKDDKAADPTNPSSDLPRFGERTPTGGFVLDPHDDSDVGIGPGLPRIRGGGDPADGPAAAAPAGMYGGGLVEDDPVAPAWTPAPEGSALGGSALGGSALGGSALGGSAPSASPLSDLTTPPPPLTSPSAPDTAASPLPVPGSAAPAAIRSDERDRFGMENNRRRGRERAAAARAESESADAVDLEARTEAMPKGKRFGAPVPVDPDLDALRKASRRGTTDIGLLVLRVAFGLLLGAHGAQKLFGVWGGPGIDGFQKYLQHLPDPSLGFHQLTKVLTIATGVVEVGGGVMLVVGVLTPIAASGALAVLISATLFKITIGGQGLVILGPDGVELELLLVAAAVTILLAGPGRLALDYGRGWSRRPAWGSAGWLVIGVAAAVVAWILLNGNNPLVVR